ncbi:MAG: polysaccharide deacetylase family protein [Peptococcaceae bacterium]|jgi:peptidoglycan-N-acetylmuramic acid deacetylase|nr:polysaccharide deacetylase family protein [Peptococcaceae bacterium]
MMKKPAGPLLAACLAASFLVLNTPGPQALAARLQTARHFTDEKIVGIVGAWGVLPTQDHSQPEIPQGVRTILDRYQTLYIGSPAEKKVYLTFDEGYEKGYTPGILDTLAKRRVPAAFFVTGHYVKKHPDLVKRMVAEGHIVGNHTMTHPSLRGLATGQIKAELDGVNEAFTALTGQTMHYLRPPRGEYDENSLATASRLGYRTVFWSLAMADWLPLPGGPAESRATVTNRLHSGAIILLHAVSADNAAALDDILHDIKDAGYSFGTLDQLAAGSLPAPAAAS